MDKIIKAIPSVFATIGGGIGYFVGGLDGLLYALIVFVTIDYITGVLVAILHKNLSSQIGFRGIAKKVSIFILVGMANVVDTKIIGSGSAIRSAVILFYCSNEGISILENAVELGLKVPKKLKDILIQINKDDADEIQDN
jgi:toxin secretion/phage lysis holin